MTRGSGRKRLRGADLAAAERGVRELLHRVAIVVSFAVVACVGCADAGIGRYRVHGTVAYGGKPVPLGRIVFEPDATRGNRGPQGFAPIEQGKFDTNHRFCQGAIGGPTVVRIDGFESGAADEDASTAGRRLFDTYETRLVLPLESTAIDFDVPAPATR
jgi:hypothetical protein